MAAKFLANCNLNLLLTKYYKEILVFQLKDEETQIYVYTTSTKPIDNFQLNLATDYNKPSDLRPIYYILLIPFSSLIPTLLSISNSLFISYTCLIFLFSLISQLFSNFKTSNYAKNNINMASTIVESNINNIERNISIFLNFNTSKEIMSMAIPIYFYAIMLYLNTLRIFFLKVQISPTFVINTAKYILIIELTKKRK